MKDHYWALQVLVEKEIHCIENENRTEQHKQQNIHCLRQFVFWGTTKHIVILKTTKITYLRIAVRLEASRFAAK